MEDGGLILRAPWFPSRGVEPAHSQHGSQGLVITLFKNQDCGHFTQFHYEKKKTEWAGLSGRVVQARGFSGGGLSLRKLPCE